MIKKFEGKILLVDDDSKNLQVAMSILKDYNVIYAQNGLKALELIEKNQFDLILLDVVMPNMDGYSVCEKIKKNELTRKIPIIFLTVKDEEKDIVRGFELGAIDYVTKPFYSEVLLKRVELHLKLANVMGELENVNRNLNDIVSEQVLEIRKKDEIINRQDRITAMSNIIHIISSQWKIPLDKLKLYLQSLQIKIDDIDNEGRKNLLDSFLEVEKLNHIMCDFQKFFNNTKNKENVNIQVSIDNALFNLKDEIEKNQIEFCTKGDNLLCLNIVNDELVHIFSELIEVSLKNFLKNSETKDKKINILIEDGGDSIYLSYEDNSKIYSEDEVSNLFEIDDKTSEGFDLGFYLVKLFIEKNGGMILPKALDQGISYTIRFDK